MIDRGTKQLCFSNERSKIMILNIGLRFQLPPQYEGAEPWSRKMIGEERELRLPIMGRYKQQKKKT